MEAKLVIPKGPRARFAVAVAASLVSAAVAGGVLLAWLVRPPASSSLSSLWLMKPNSAVAVLATSVALLLAASPGRDPRGRLRRLLGAAVCALAFATLAEYATGIDLGVDQLLAADPSGSIPGRMSPWTAATLALVAAAVAAHGSRVDALADLALAASALCLQLIIAGYLYGVVELYGIDRSIRVSPQTLVCMVALWIALAALRVGRGRLEIAMRPTAAGAAIRWLVPVALVLPPVTGWLRLLAQREGVIATPQMGFALFAVAQTLVLVALIYGLARHLDTLEARYLAERERRGSLERLVAVCAWTGRIRWQGEWIRVERYLKERWDVAVTHTISDDAFDAMERELEKLEVDGNGDGKP
jgi:hypothetical protein